MLFKSLLFKLVINFKFECIKLKQFAKIPYIIILNKNKVINLADS